MALEKRRLFRLFSLRQLLIDNIKWQTLIVVIVIILLALIITLVCEHSNGSFRCRHFHKNAAHETKE